MPRFESAYCESRHFFLRHFFLRRFFFVELCATKIKTPGRWG